MTAEARFWNRVNKTDTCWLWLGSLASRGYGWMCYDGKRTPVHRYAYELLVGKIPDGLHIDHLCRVPACVNPAHLEPVTVRENTLRGVGITAQQAKQTECKFGHQFTPENIYLYKEHRYCRECNKIRCRAYRTRKGKGTDVQ